MPDLDDPPSGGMSSEVTIEQLSEERSALQAQNAQLWRLVDKQRAMIHSLQKDLDKATAVLRNDPARRSTSADGALPYPTTPTKYEHSEHMPNAPDVIEDYDDVSTTTEQSPDAFSAGSTNGKSKIKRGSPRSLDFHHASRLADGDPPVKSPLRTATTARKPAVEEHPPSLLNGTTVPMSPALSLRLQQINRNVSPLTQSFPNLAQSNSLDRSGIEEIERVNVPRRERVRSPHSRASSYHQMTPVEETGSPMLRAEQRPTQASENTARPQTIDERSRPSLFSAKSDISSLHTEPVTLTDTTRNTQVSDAAMSSLDVPRTTMSKSESGGTLADIAAPYYCESSVHLPLNAAPDSTQFSTNHNMNIPLRSRKSPRPASPESNYAASQESENVPRTPPHSQKPLANLEPPVEFLPTPAKYVWNEHSPERFRSGSITSMVSELSMQPSESTPSVGTNASSIVPAKEVANVKVFMVDFKARCYIDFGIFRHDMILLHKLRKTHADLIELQRTIKVQSDVQLPTTDEFESDLPIHQNTRRTTVDLWFSSLQDQIRQERDAHSAAVLSNFLSNDVLTQAHEVHGTLPVVEDQALSRDSSIASFPSKDLARPQRASTKEGFLKKRGKNFGGWRSRFFVLENSTLKFYESPGGSHLGTINLILAQIGRQQSQGEASSGLSDKDAERQQHAFLILEPKKRNTNSFVRHVLCASTETEREDWIAALMPHVHNPETSADTNPVRKGSRTEQKLARHMNLTTPTRGTPYEANEPSPKSFAKDNFAAIGYGETKAGRQPLFDPNNIMPASPHSRATMDSEISSMSISRPMHGAPIENNTAWGATALSSPSMNLPTPPAMPNVQAEKKSKKKSFWTFGKGAEHPTSQRDLSTVQSPSYGDLTFAQPSVVAQTSGLFGIPLSEAVHIALEQGFHNGVPTVVSRCIDYLDMKHAEQEEGIYRLSGSSNVIRGLKEKFNQEMDINLAGGGEYFDIHAIAGLLKLYLRELPSSILTQDLQRDFLDILEIPEGLARTITVRTLVHSLPRDNFELLKILSRHLSVIVSNADINKMSLRNVGIVFSPTLNIPAAVFQLFIAEYDALFEDRPTERSRSLAPPHMNDAASIRSTRSNNPTASVVLDADQSYNLLQQDFSSASQTANNTPYGLHSRYNSAHNTSADDGGRFANQYV